MSDLYFLRPRLNYGFCKPYEEIDINSILSQIRNLESGQKLEIQVNHPYYRKKIHDLCDTLGYYFKSFINEDVPLHEDNTLVLHFKCNKSTPSAKMKWHEDTDSNGDYYQSYATCHHCDRFLFSEYRCSNFHEERNMEYGYMYVYGKNFVRIVGR